MFSDGILGSTGELVDPPILLAVEDIVNADQADLNSSTDRNKESRTKPRGEGLRRCNTTSLKADKIELLTPTLTGGDKQLDRVSARSGRSDRLAVNIETQSRSDRVLRRKGGRRSSRPHVEATAFTRVHYLRRVLENEGSDRLRLAMAEVCALHLMLEKWARNRNPSCGVPGCDRP